MGNINLVYRSKYNIDSEVLGTFQHRYVTESGTWCALDNGMVDLLDVIPNANLDDEVTFFAISEIHISVSYKNKVNYNGHREKLNVKLLKELKII